MARKAKSNAGGIATTQGQYCLDCRKELDCGHEPEMYLVDDELWKQARLEMFDGLRLHHLSARIGRPLRHADFVHMRAPGDRADWEGTLDEDVLVLFEH